MKKYKCGPFIYNFPESCCAFCKHADIFWDYTNGIYMIICDKGNQIDSVVKFEHGCDEVERYEED